MKSDCPLCKGESVTIPLKKHVQDMLCTLCLSRVCDFMLAVVVGDMAGVSLRSKQEG